MKELSLNILDIAQNSIKARAKTVWITLEEDDRTLTFTIRDDGCGMSEDFLEKVTDPFTTTRTTRSVGLGLPLLKMEAEMAGGSFSVTSTSEEVSADHGTIVKASFNKTNIDYIPLGDIVGTILVLVGGLGETDLEFTHKFPGGEAGLSTAQLKSVLGDVPLDTPEVLEWIREYLSGQYES